MLAPEWYRDAQKGAIMDFGLFSTWNAVYADGKVPWDPDYKGGKLLESAAYDTNFREVHLIEAGGWDYL